MKGFFLFGSLLTAVVVVVSFIWRPALSTRPLPSHAMASIPANWASAEPIQPIPPVPDLDPAKVSIGEKLFRDVRISRDNTVSCATCHQLEYAGDDGLPHSARMDGTLTPMHTPTIFNVSLNFRLFWDGRKKTLEEQIQSPRDTQTVWHEVLGKLRNDPDYQAQFAKAYPREGMTETTLKDAIVTFERSLVTPDSRFDRYLRGQKNAITTREKMGYRLFKDYGCISCHQGVNVGGNLFQKLGVIKDYFSTHPVTDADMGRYNVTKQETDRHVFRVPSLRNVAVTAPYLHNGSIPTLRDVIHEMAEHQLGRPIPDQDVDLIIEFLRTLTGEYRGKLLQDGRG